ncbi:PEP-CTERM sorting domain-containing protein [Haloferula sp. A504]|uniref:PEP-CTERM sorting domain-containing protein n=1 Tax=Haloferula sp. A504 TaxID=3373601 RepID=UPI0031C4D402|nr:PEP-CTERM sorting domain-containing protein [Verrucomicrobiaceae bacterium E54]
MKRAHPFPRSIPAIASGFALTVMTAGGATVWNVNVGNTVNSTHQITTTDNYVGAATENTANSVWNGITGSTTVTLADSTGSTSAGVTFTVTPAAGSAVNFSNNSGTVGDEIFKSWIKDGGTNGSNNDPYEVTFAGLTTAAGTTYSLVVYSGWVFGPDNVPISQTAGSGLTGTFNLNSLDMEAGNPLATGLAPDTNAADAAGNFNYARFDGLTADGSGNLTFSFGGPSGVDAPINGFQLVQVPEPSASALVGGLGLLALLRRRRFR